MTRLEAGRVLEPQDGHRSRLFDDHVERPFATQLAVVGLEDPAVEEAARVAGTRPQLEGPLAVDRRGALRAAGSREP